MMFKIILSRFALLIVLCLPATAMAVTACVSNTSQLEQALAGASDLADDDIRLQTAVFQLSPFSNVNLRGDVRISGGWAPGCVIQSATNAQSQLNGDGATSDFIAWVTSGGGITLSRLTFTNWREISIRALQESVEAGELRIDRCRLSGARLFLTTRALPITLQNSILSGHSGTAVQIFNQDSNGDTPELLVQFNTIVQPTGATPIGLLISGNIPFGQRRIFNNLINGHTTDVLLRGQAFELRSNHYGPISFLNGASLSATSGNNLSGDPSISSLLPFGPIEPSSPLINAGEAIVGALPSRDFVGNPRRIGTKPDIGAVESSVNDSSEIVVSNSNDSGTGSLRAAIVTANTNPALKTISFNIPGACPRTISPQSALPALTRPVVVDGYTQPGSAPNTQSRSFDGTLCVVLNGGSSQANGLTLQTLVADDQMTVKGLMFYGFSSEAIRVEGPGRGFVSGNLFGTGSNLISTFADSVIRVNNAPGTVIGGADEADINVIGLGQMAGVRLEASSARRTVTNNFIGMGRSGNSALPNAIGVLVEGGTDDLITSNWITDNSAHGVHIAAAPISSRVRILRNRIGLRSQGGVADGGNGGNAVRISAGTEHLLSSNTINNSGTDGIAVLAAARRVLLSPNSFSRNQLQPIDLSPDGVNVIDLDVGQTGANDQQNTAELLSARGSSVQGEVRARLRSDNGNYLIDLFFSSSCPNVNGFVNGGSFLARSAPITLTCATASSNCELATTIAVDNAQLGNASLLGGFITALVIDEQNNTSEFSACEPYVLGDNIFKSGFE